MSVWFQRRSRSARLALAALVVVAIIAPLASMLAPATPAEAHAALIRGTPSGNETLTRPPARVTLTFSEPIERELTKIEVLNADQEQVDNKDIAFDDANQAFASVGLPALEPGLYYVRWSNVSKVDGHGLSGQYPFIILNPDGTFPDGVSFDDATGTTSGGDLLPKPIDVALKWIALITLTTIAGAVFFVIAVLRPAAAFLDDEKRPIVREEGDRWLINLGHVLLPASFIAMAFLVLITVSRFETGTTLWQYLTSVRTGEYRAVGLVAVLVALAGADLLFLSTRRWLRNAGLALMLLGTIAAMATYSLVSHSATGTGKYWATIGDFVHLSASATWLGALAMLPLIMWPLRKKLPETERLLFSANMFDRFSVVAGVSVVVVLAAGLFNGLAAIPSWDALGDTTYGRVLIAKLVVIAPLLGVAGLNAFILKPRFVAAIDAEYQQAGTVARSGANAPTPNIDWLERWLPRTIIAEVILVIAVFAVVGVLTQTSTAESEVAARRAAEAASSKYSQSSEVDGLVLTLQVTPNQVGINEFSLAIQNASDASPVASVTQSRLRFEYDEVPGLVPPQQLLLNRFGDGDFRGQGAYLTQKGNWRVEASIRRSDGDDISRTYRLPVSPAFEADTGDGGGGWELPFTSFHWNEIGGAALVLLGVMLVIYRREIRTLPKPTGSLAMGTAVAAMLAGAVLAFGVDTHTKPLNPSAGNPIPPTKESVERGRVLYEQNCVVCHGADGRGDGPGAAELNPQPTDFRLHTPLHTDVQFYNFIADGFPGSAMPAFRDQLSEEDIWNLVNFLRAAFSDAPTQ